MQASPTSAMTPSKTVIKINHRDNLHRFTMEQGVPIPALPGFLARCAEVCGADPDGHYRLRWCDDDGDVISVMNDADFLEALQSGPVLRLVLQEEVSPDVGVEADFKRLNLANGKGGRGRGEPALERRARQVAEALGSDIESAKSLIKRAWDGESDAKQLLLESRKSNMALAVAGIRGTSLEGARELVDRAMAGDSEARQDLHGMGVKGGMKGGFGKGVKGMKGFGKGVKGAEECEGMAEESTAAGNTDVAKRAGHALARLTGMESRQAQKLAGLAVEGDAEAQSQIGSAIEAADLSGSESPGSEWNGKGGGKKQYMLKVLKTLAKGELAVFGDMTKGFTAKGKGGKGKGCMGKGRKGKGRKGKGAFGGGKGSDSWAGGWMARY